MGLTNDERSSLVELRLEKAKRFIAEAEQMLSMGLWDLAANRFYYSCFHAAQALLIHYGLSAHTHAGTLGVFGMNFVKTGKIDKELGAFFSRMEQLRMKADYNYLRSCHLWIRSDKFVDGSFSLHELFPLLDFFGCFFLFVGELFGVVGELFF